jgi:hypothetical protein
MVSAQGATDAMMRVPPDAGHVPQVHQWQAARGRTIQAVVEALERHGVEIVEDGIRLRPKAKPRH